MSQSEPRLSAPLFKTSFTPNVDLAGVYAKRTIKQTEERPVSLISVSEVQFDVPSQIVHCKRIAEAIIGRIDTALQPKTMLKQLARLEHRLMLATLRLFARRLEKIGPLAVEKWHDC